MFQVRIQHIYSNIFISFALKGKTHPILAIRDQYGVLTKIPIFPDQNSHFFPAYPLASISSKRKNPHIMLYKLKKHIYFFC